MYSLTRPKYTFARAPSCGLILTDIRLTAAGVGTEVAFRTAGFGLVPERISIMSSLLDAGVEAAEGGGREMSCGLYGAEMGFLGSPRSSLKISVGVAGSLDGGRFWLALREASSRNTVMGGEKPIISI